jgi:hypothetical protein
MLESTWDLSVFYAGFDDPALRADIDAVRTLTAEAAKCSSGTCPPRKSWKRSWTGWRPW